MCENKVTTKCYVMEMWQRRWTSSRKVFGMRISPKEDPEDTLVEKEPVKKQSGSDHKSSKLATQTSHSEVLSFTYKFCQYLKIQRFMLNPDF